MNKTCGCCEGLQKLTPMSTANRPGLEAISYRIGTHAGFLETMKARLSNLYLEMEEFDEQGNPKISGIYPLQALTTRAADDPAIALLDAWAILADVLSFYQERIANEGYLRTATERRSIQELARLVGYKLRSGVAASVYLAFTLEKDYEVEIPAGTRAQSLPGPGELPQAFETAEPLLARTEWNELKPRITQPQYITSETNTLYLKGITTKLKPNDPLIIVDSLGGSHFRRVSRIETELTADRTKVILSIKGEVDLNLVELETLIKPANIPEEEGPYSVAIGDWISGQIRINMETLLKDLRKPEQSVEVLKNNVQAQIPLFEQTIRIYKALNFDILAVWADKIRRQLAAILRRLEQRPATATDPVGSNINQDYVKAAKAAITTILQKLPEPSAETRFAQKIWTPESKAIKESMNELLKSQKITVREVSSLIFCLEQLLHVFKTLGSGDLTPLYDALNCLQEPPEVQPTPSKDTKPRLQVAAFVSSLNIMLPHLLKKQVALPPANALRLKRSRSQIFTANADISSKILTELKPVRLSVPVMKAALKNVTIKPGPAKVYVLRTTASLFGHNAQKQVTYKSIPPSEVPTSPPESGISGEGETTSERVIIPDIPEEWQEWSLATEEASNTVFLDNAYEQIVSGSYIAIKTPLASSPEIFANIGAFIHPRTAYGISAKTTEITLADGDNWWDPQPDSFNFIRGTVVYAQSELLELAEEPLETEVQKNTIVLNGLYEGLEAGRWLIVSGERTDISGTNGVNASELMMLAGVTHDMDENLPGDRLHSTLILANELTYTYKRDTAVIYGNVVKATHGETRKEVLGSGDGSKTLQSFTLSQSPLTHLTAATPSGAESTLEVRVNDVSWPEVENLFELCSTDRGYITRTDDESKTTLIFGDGQHGTRLPTGAENVTAVYRFGMGKAGNVAAEQINLLATRPLGVKGVINPLPATGGADRENRDRARRNTPLGVMALDRLVSVQDYADFARTYAGIGKASAARLSDGQQEVVHITIAGAGDIPIDKASDLYRNLCQALHQCGDPYQPIQVDVRELMLLVISARVRIKSDHLWEKVEPKIRASLLEAFGFERRELGQDVLLSEVISVIQGVPGVAYVDVDLLNSISENEAINLERLSQKLQELAGQNGTKGENGTTEGNESDGENGSNGKIAQPWKRIVVEMDRVDCERKIQAAQLAILSPEMPETLILQEKTT